MFLMLWIAFVSLPVNVSSMWAITVWTSAEQFFGMFRRMGSKYFQKLLNDEHYRRSGRRKKVDREAHRIAWTTPEDA
jgi:hypothetical protein